MITTYSVTLIPEENIYRVENPNGGPRLSFSPNSGVQLLEVQDGPFTYAFKDLNRNGVLDPYEDWRLSPEERARDLAARLTVEQMSGIMLYPVGEPNDDSGDVGEKEMMQILKRHIRFLHGNRSNKKNAVRFGNNIQALSEKNDPNGIPMNQASDPRNTVAGGRFVMFDNQDMSPWPGNLGLAATFDPEYVLKHGQIVSKEYRAMCITTALSPQVDLATEPRWSRFAGTFGEGSLLAGDMAAAYVHGFQSTWDGIGKDAKDLGWGKDSVVTMIKHFPGDGAAEGGREAHNNFGKFNVYPGYNMKEHASVFGAAFDIPDSQTGGAKAVMPSYSIAMSPTGPIGEAKGSGYSKYKLTTLLQEEMGFDGNICADWDITTNKQWGMETRSKIERHYQAFQAGLNMIGGCNDMEISKDAFEFGKMVRKQYVDDLPMPPEFAAFAAGWGQDAGDPRPPEEQMLELYRTSAERCLRMSFYCGLFEDPYRLQSETDALLAETKDCKEAFDAQLASLVLLKNKGKIIRKSDGGKKTVYIPLRYEPASHSMFFSAPASISMPFDGCKKLREYFNVVTDALRDGTDPADLKPGDIIRRTDFNGVDFALISASNPVGNNGYDADRVNLDPQKGPIDNGYIPISLQYRPYYADPAICRETAIGLDPDEELTWIKAGGKPGTSRTYAGKTVTTSNEQDLDMILDTRKAIGDLPLLVYLTVSNPMCFHEFEPQAEGILVGFSVSEDAALEVIAGRFEPQGLLPCQMPAGMETVERQFEDVPFDMECHTDSEGHVYEYAFGLDYDGVISDWRTEKYGRNAYK